MTRDRGPGTGVEHGELQDDAAEELAALRREIEGLRAASRLRAVVEQAKGVLVARHGISLDEAFDRLRQLSQQNNVRLVEVAATLVGVSVPDTAGLPDDLAARLLDELAPLSTETSTSWQTLRQQPDVKAGTATALLDSIASSTGDGDQAARLILDLMSSLQVKAVSMFRVSADGALRLVGQVGFPGDLISAWRSIPLSMDVPYCRAVNDRTPVLMRDRQTRLETFPALGSVTSAYEATAVIPVTDAGAVIGVVGLGWAGARDFDEQQEQEIISSIGRVGPLLLRHVAAADPELAWLDAVLAVHFDPWVLLDVVPGQGEAVRDFVVHSVSSRAGVGTAWLGRRLLELWPSTASTETVAVLGDLTRRGGTWTTTIAERSDLPWGAPGVQLRAVRLDRRVVVVWRRGGA